MDCCEGLSLAPGLFGSSLADFRVLVRRRRTYKRKQSSNTRAERPTGSAAVHLIALQKLRSTRQCTVDCLWATPPVRKTFKEHIWPPSVKF